jgi:GDP-4-dehydro-6-deoxy-D-mannose reductase
VSGIPLVTGAGGFAGRHLIDHLLELEARVAAWTNPHGHGSPGSRGDGRVQWVAVDVTDTEAVTRALAELQPSSIYHCAGVADVHGAWTNSARALHVNVIGTHAVLTALERVNLNIPVVVTGSALVYRPSSEPLTESSPIGPTSPYGVSKLGQEMVASAARGRVIVARPFNHAGPRQSDAYVTSSFARQIAEAEAGVREPVLRVGNLDARRDITDVRDTVRAYRLLMEHGQAGRPYNVCCGNAYRVRDLLESLVARSTINIRVEVDPARLRPSDNPVVVGSFARIESETGWRPCIDIDRTLGDLLEYWRGAVQGSGR